MHTSVSFYLLQSLFVINKSNHNNTLYAQNKNVYGEAVLITKWYKSVIIASERSERAPRNIYFKHISHTPKQTHGY